MSNGTIIICTTAGEELGDKTIEVYDATVLSFAVKLDLTALQQYPDVSPRDAKRVERLLRRGYQRVLEELEDLGVPYIQHEPHPGNL